MKKIKVLYWIFTGLLAVLMTMSSIPGLTGDPQAAAVFTHLGYPLYLVPFLSIAKLLGAIAILVPGFKTIKEWAYAGFVFDLAGAMYSSISVGDPASGWMTLFIGFAIIGASYYFWRRKLKFQQNQSPAREHSGVLLSGALA
ncbi:MAG: DoxX family protein [Chitinophagaceae bacterium]